MLNSIKRNMKRWFISWLMIFDCLVCIFTLEFFYGDAVGWWYSEIGTPWIDKENPMSIKSRVQFWIIDWISILEASITILSLGLFRPHFLSALFLTVR